MNAPGDKTTSSQFKPKIPMVLDLKEDKPGEKQTDNADKESDWPRLILISTMLNEFKSDLSSYLAGQESSCFCSYL